MTKASNADPVTPTSRDACQPIVDKRTWRSGFTLWLWVAAGFLFLAILWAAMFTAARSADTRTVPLATQGGRP